MKYYVDVLKKYAEFNGRASRTEYWMFRLYSLLAVLILACIGLIFFKYISILGMVGLVLAYGLAVLLPSFAVLVRRLHDTSHSAWWLLIPLIPWIGAIWLLVLTVLDSTPGQNKFGQNPKGIAVI